MRIQYTMTPDLTIDTRNSRLSFTVQKLGLLPVSGTITNMKGKIVFNQAALSESYLNIFLDSATLNTGNAKRDAHLKSEDFFHVTRYPRITFKSKTITEKDNSYQVVGYVSILDITRKIEFELNFIQDAFKGQFEVRRKDFNLGNRISSLIIGDKVQLKIDCKIQN